MTSFTQEDVVRVAEDLSDGMLMLVRDPDPGEPFNKASWRNICPTTAAFNEAEKLGLIVPVGDQFVHAEFGKAVRNHLKETSK